MLDFDVRTIDNALQRYPTVGDYHTDAYGVTHFRISNMSSWRYELLVTIHELIEKYLCQEVEISEAAIDKFDMEFEARRKLGDTSEPGDDPTAPYHNQHVIATEIEKHIANKLGVNWRTYEKYIENL